MWILDYRYVSEKTWDIFSRWIGANRMKQHIREVQFIYTGHFIMFSLITNIYNKKTKGPTLIEFSTATGKLNFFFIFDRLQHFNVCVSTTLISYRCVPYHLWCTYRTSLFVKKKNFSVFLWLWKIPLRYVLWFSCYKCF